MGKVMFQLTDRNLSIIAESPKFPYSVRKMAAKLLEDRRKDARYAAMVK